MGTALTAGWGHVIGAVTSNFFCVIYQKLDATSFNQPTVLLVQESIPLLNSDKLK